MYCMLSYMEEEHHMSPMCFLGVFFNAIIPGFFRGQPDFSVAVKWLYLQAGALKGRFSMPFFSTSH